MATLPVLRFPHPLLKQQAQPVTRFDAELKRLAEAMLRTMYAEGGIGLAANQVGQLRRLIVVDLKNGSEAEGQPPVREPHFYINPRILDGSGELVTEEGCLSVVDFRAEVKRCQRVTVEYQSLTGEPQQAEMQDMAAVCLQHEIDHLNGKLFIDHLPPLKRQMIKKRLIKLQRTA